ncbi:TetR/AcrR family transcriptional regulator [Cupriavidus basilensis]
MATPSARERILDTAARLFYQDGLRATGIDKIIAESGVAKMSLYRHFASKNELISAFLDRRHDNWMAWFEQDVEARFAATPGLEVIADALADWFTDGEFRGCAFINAVAEAGPQARARRSSNRWRTRRRSPRVSARWSGGSACRSPTRLPKRRCFAWRA